MGWWWFVELQKETTYAMRNASLQLQSDLFGSTELRPRWQRCKDETNLNLGFALSREYVDEFMAPTTKTEVWERQINDLSVCLLSALYIFDNPRYISVSTHLCLEAGEKFSQMWLSFHHCLIGFRDHGIWEIQNVDTEKSPWGSMMGNCNCQNLGVRLSIN